MIKTLNIIENSVHKGVLMIMDIPYSEKNLPSYSFSESYIDDKIKSFGFMLDKMGESFSGYY